MTIAFGQKFQLCDCNPVVVLELQVSLTIITVFFFKNKPKLIGCGLIALIVGAAAITALRHKNKESS
jgi:hypothetical protein